MRIINERALNSTGFVAVMLCLLLPFVRLVVPEWLGTGGLWWTGGDLLAGGGFDEDIALSRTEMDGSVTPEPIAFAKLYSPEYESALRNLPQIIAAVVAGVLMLLGAIAAQVLRSHVRFTGAVVAIAAIGALSTAQAQAVDHMTRAWDFVRDSGAESELFNPNAEIGGAYA